MTLTKFDNLIIRACKSRHPYDRLVSVYNKFYYKGYGRTVPASLLIYMVEETFSKLITIKLLDLYTHTNPKSIYYCTDHATTYLNYIVNKLRFISNTELPDSFLKPRRFK